jgi:exodeoxyribonuclease-3
MKLISFNVNGLRSVLSKNKYGKKLTDEKNVLESIIQEYNPDIICLQETRCPGDCKVKIELDEFLFKRILPSTTKKGYSGVAIFSKTEPIHVYDDFSLNNEGRVLCAEYNDFFIVNAYVPNSKNDLSRLDERVNIWEVEIRKYITHLQKSKPVIYCADFNVAPNEIDIINPKGHKDSPGFTIQERNAFAKLLDECNLIDSFRLLHPNDIKYSWFSNFGKSRENNKGWRIDHFLVDQKLKKYIIKADILNDIYGSDHCPILLEIKV